MLKLLHLRNLAISALVTMSTLPGFGAVYEDGEIAYSKGNFALAGMRFRQVARQNNKRAQFNLDIMYALGQGVEQDPIKANMWLNIAASRGRSGVGDSAVLASGISPQQFAKLEVMMAECRSSKLQNCDDQSQTPLGAYIDGKTSDKAGKHKLKHTRVGHISAVACAPHKKNNPSVLSAISLGIH